MIGQRIREERKKKSMSMQALADICGTSSSYISDLENGKIKKPSFEMIIKIADALYVPVSYFSEGDSFAKVIKENQVKRREYTKTYTTDELKELEKDSFLIKCSEEEKALKLLTFLNLSEEIINSPLLEKSERKKFSELCGTIIDNWSNYMDENVYDSIINVSISLTKSK